MDDPVPIGNVDEMTIYKWEDVKDRKDLHLTCPVGDAHLTQWVRINDDKAIAICLTCTNTKTIFKEGVEGK